MKSKTYQIDGAGFCLKEDLTVEESEMVQKLLNSFYCVEEGYLNNNMPAVDIKRFLSLVLEPENISEVDAEIDFGKAKESVVLEIIKDFFLWRMRLTRNMTDYLKSLMKELELQ